MENSLVRILSILKIKRGVDGAILLGQRKYTSIFELHFKNTHLFVETNP